MSRTTEQVADRAEACRTCGAPIVWARTIRGGLMPVDASPSKGGNLALGIDPADGLLAAQVVPARTAAAMRAAHEPTFVSHFVSCPNAESWRKSR